jgi:hypothetical protein
MFLHENINGQTANAQKCINSLALLLMHQFTCIIITLSESTYCQAQRTIKNKMIAHMPLDWYWLHTVKARVVNILQKIQKNETAKIS